MSRPRSRKKTTSIHFTIPISLYTKLEDNLAGMESRSAWITRAIEQKFEGTTIASASNKQLLIALVNRGIISADLYAEILVLSESL
jgi:hypothetical protein